MDESTYLRFERDQTRETGTTQVWLVISSRHGNVLGRISWFGRWRQYAFHPEPDTVWNVACLADVAIVVNRLMAERRVKARNPS